MKQEERDQKKELELRQNELLCEWLSERTKGREDDPIYEVHPVYSWPRHVKPVCIPFEIWECTRWKMGIEPYTLAPFTRSLDSLALVVGAMTDSEREYYRHQLVGESGAWLGEGAIDADAQTRADCALVALGLWERKGV